jgi:hypothetical protein
MSSLAPYVAWVCDERFLTCISSIMRRRSGPMSNCQEESLILPFRGVGH